ncbi:MAG: D-alanyl-D-alanine carboxypeptidase [Gammaproteobacteria bacterium]|nr:D-alanyl-D-alanine carboxypeptidase [Gammaproteobacteria bacterium]
MAALLVALGGACPAWAVAPIPPPPVVNAHSWILVDHFSGRVLAENDADARVEPASLTKLMTAYVVFAALRDHRVKLTDMVPISARAWRTGGSRTFLQVGTQVPLDILLKGMIVQSGNDATVALAEDLGGTDTAFAQMMNEYARRLGMKSSHFVNSDGLPSPEHYTTARDVATLSNALIREFPQFYSLFSMREFVWNNIRQGNRNTLLDRDPSVDGLKTGHTDTAGFCLASSANRNGMRLVAVVMGSPNEKGREEASAALLNYGYTFFETLRIKAAHETVLNPRVYKSANEFAAVGVPYDVYATVGRGEASTLRTRALLNREPLLAPLAAGEVIGELSVADASNTVIARVPLVPLAAVPTGSLSTRMVDSVALWFR